jgi:hypothetical protein
VCVYGSEVVNVGLLHVTTARGKGAFAT